MINSCMVMVIKNGVIPTQFLFGQSVLACAGGT
jgi:hypothetical protein